MFVDFCGVKNTKLPVSQPYYCIWTREKARWTLTHCTSYRHAALFRLKDSIAKEIAWSNVPTVAGAFKCARLQGGNMTGGLCGKWDNNKNRKLFMLDKDSIKVR